MFNSVTAPNALATGRSWTLDVVVFLKRVGENQELMKELSRIVLSAEFPH